MEAQLKIVLLEGVAADAMLIEHELAQGGVNFVARRAEDREEFLELLQAFVPDVILADFTLPRFSALEALRELSKAGADVPFILVTGSHSEEVAVECMKAGADDYILKGSLKWLPTAVKKTLKKRAAQAAFRRSEEQYRLITENTADLVSLLDLQFNFLYASPSFKRVLGHEPAELVGGNCLGLVHEEDNSVLLAAFEEVFESGEACMVEVRFRTAEGSWQTFESTASLIFGEGGKPERALLVSRDISDRKRAEREIRKLAAFPQFNPNPVLEFAGDGTLTYFNDAVLEMARSMGKDHPQAILPLTTSTVVKMCLSTGQNKLHMETSVGGRILSWSFFPVVSNGVVHCYAEDITESMDLEAELRQVQKMESVGQLAAGVAHDFNNILTIVQGHAGLMLADPEIPRMLADSAKQIALAAERAANLTRQLLMFSRKQVMQSQLLDLNEVIVNLSKMLRCLVGEQVTLRRHYGSDLPAIDADAGMMEQILVNLAVNARDAMPRGGRISITTAAVEIDEEYVQRHPEAKEGYHVCLSVSDAGHGMDAETASRIFEPFFTTKDVGKGTGLGLATVYGIVKQHRGWIEVETEPGSGTTFKVFIRAASKAHGSAGSGPSRGVPGGTETILLVEDESSLRELVKEILEKKGYTVLGAPTGLQALEVWKGHKYEIDLLLTDMMMPEGVSGRELAENLLADRQDLKVIYSSGYSLDAVSSDFGANDGPMFLQKPYHPETLARTVRDCLDEVKSTASPSREEETNSLRPV